MKTFLRDMATRQYFQSPQKWTSDREQALDFGLVSRAMRIARKLRIPDLELEFSLEDLEEPATASFEQFVRGVMHPRRRRLQTSHA